MESETAIDLHIRLVSDLFSQPMIFLSGLFWPRSTVTFALQRTIKAFFFPGANIEDEAYLSEASFD